MELLAAGAGVSVPEAGQLVLPGAEYFGSDSWYFSVVACDADRTDCLCVDGGSREGRCRRLPEVQG